MFSRLKKIEQKKYLWNNTERLYEHLPAPENHPGYTDIVDIDMYQAFLYYEKGYKYGNAESSYKAGLFYENFGHYAGRVPLNIEAARERYIRGAKRGNIDCQKRYNILANSTNYYKN